MPDVAKSKDPESAAVLATLQQTLASFNSNNSKAEIAEEPAVEACIKAAETGVLGPFAFAEDDEGS
ncbi:unnamed protein product, partial [Symbiodinium necroappetens]